MRAVITLQNSNFLAALGLPWVAQGWLPLEEKGRKFQAEVQLVLAL